MARKNLCPNPKFDANITDGYQARAGSWERVTAPPVAFPAGFTACQRPTTNGATATIQKAAVDASWNNFCASLWALGDAGYADKFTFDITQYDASMAYLTGFGSGQIDPDTAAWTRYTVGPVARHANAAWVILFLQCVASNKMHMTTGFMLDPSDTMSAAYADGDTAGWVWTGTPENSISEENPLVDLTYFIPNRVRNPRFLGGSLLYDNTHGAYGFDVWEIVVPGDTTGLPSWVVGSAKALHLHDTNSLLQTREAWNTIEIPLQPSSIFDLSFYHHTVNVGGAYYEIHFRQFNSADVQVGATLAVPLAASGAGFVRSKTQFTTEATADHGRLEIARVIGNQECETWLTCLMVSPTNVSGHPAYNDGSRIPILGAGLI